LNIIKEINSYEKEQIELNLNESFFSSPKRDSNKNGIKSSGQMKAITSSIPAISYDKMKKKKMESIPEIENDSENDDDEQSESEKDESSEKTEKRGKFVKIKKVESESEDEPVKTGYFILQNIKNKFISKIYICSKRIENFSAKKY
jgi:hypothetical protein